MKQKSLLRVVAVVACTWFGGMAASAQEPYAALSDDGQTVTFYYDTQKASRGGVEINSSSFGNPYASVTTAVFDASFADYRPTSTVNWYKDCTALTTISGMENLNTSDVTDMGFMFADCSSLTRLDVSGFNTENVVNMGLMFSGCRKLRYLNVSGFNTASVTSMEGMFWNCSALTSLDVSGFNTAKVTDMYSMFYGCESLTSLDVSGFNTANVTNMRSLFYGCKWLETIYADEEKWSTKAVTNGYGMFTGCTELVGGNGTAYDENHTDKEYACIDKEGQPGYLTQKVDTEWMRFDVNGDGRVTITDAVAVVNYILNHGATANAPKKAK